MGTAEETSLAEVAATAEETSLAEVAAAMVIRLDTSAPSWRFPGEETS